MEKGHVFVGTNELQSETTMKLCLYETIAWRSVLPLPSTNTPTCHNQQIRGRNQNISTSAGRIKHLPVPADVARRLPRDTTQQDVYRHPSMQRASLNIGSCSVLQ